MREILFRGKRSDNGEWAESTYPFGTMSSGVVVHDFDPATIGQYTGLTDKNGVKIFEGDICEIDREEGTFEIVWNNPEARYACVGAEFTFDFDQFGQNDIWVIGNIHDNPEILEAKK